LKTDFFSILVAIELGRLVFDKLMKVILYLMPVCKISPFKLSIPSNFEQKLQAGMHTEFITVFANVFLGTQLALSSYLQVCFSITNDVVTSISLMYGKPESGKSLINFFKPHIQTFYFSFLKKISWLANLVMMQPQVKTPVMMKGNP
jgi:hypothetical protein